MRVKSASGLITEEEGGYIELAGIVKLDNWADRNLRNYTKGG